MGIDNKRLEIVSDNFEDIRKALQLIPSMLLSSSKDRLKIKSITDKLIVLKPTDDISILKFEHYDVAMLKTLYKKMRFVYDPKLDQDLCSHDSQEEAYQLTFDDSVEEVRLRITEIGFSK